MRKFLLFTDDDENSDDETPRSKFIKPSNPTDFLSELSSATSKDNKNLHKNSIASLVKPKTTDSKKKNLLVKSKNTLVKPKELLKNSFVKPKSAESKPEPEEEKKSSSNGTTSNSLGLGLLGAYSDSDENSDWIENKFYKFQWAVRPIYHMRAQSFLARESKRLKSTFLSSKYLPIYFFEFSSNNFFTPFFRDFFFAVYNLQFFPEYYCNELYSY